MDAAVIKIFGQIAGIGGLALGVFLFLFREIIRKKIFPTLTKEHAYKIIRLMLILIWSTSLVAIFAWLYIKTTNSLSLSNATESITSSTDSIPSFRLSESDSSDGKLRVHLRSAHTGEVHTVMASPHASIKWLVELAKHTFRLKDTAGTGAFVPFKVRWVLVDTQAKEKWEKLPRYRQSRIRAIVSTDEGEKYSFDENESLEDLNIYDGISFFIYAIEDEDYPPSPACQPRTETYNVILLIPSTMTGAEILVDDKPARIVAQSPNVVRIRVEEKDTSHRITLRKGENSCTTEVLIRQDNLRVFPCH